MKEQFLQISDYHDLSKFFGMSSSELIAILYPPKIIRKYESFLIPKKNGDSRTIKVPNKKLKRVQSHLKDVLYEIYKPRTSVHGFLPGKSIVTNARMHLDKRFVFNIDLKHFFDSIHFGRVKHLFMAKPFYFKENVATMLAQICCFENSLPQGAPTSPIISNMIAFRMDAQLRDIARRCQSTYTRYADDITFSFSCLKKNLPSEIVISNLDFVQTGEIVSKIINDTGFEINTSKVRLSERGDRLEVTGITVNQSPNLRRKYVQKIKSMLYAWENFGYKDAENEYLLKHDIEKRRVRKSSEPFKYIVRGKIAFLKSVIGKDNPIFYNLAMRFNKLIADEFLKFHISDKVKPRNLVVDSLWIIEYNCTINNNKCFGQGIGFDLENFGIVTSAHVVGDMNKRIIFDNIYAYKYNNQLRKYNLKVKKIDFDRDLACCNLIINSEKSPNLYPLRCSDIEPQVNILLKLYGFPGYAPGKQPFQADIKIAALQTISTVRRFEVDHMLRSGNSGGPLVDSHGDVIGIAKLGQDGNSGENTAVCISELFKAFPQGILD